MKSKKNPSWKRLDNAAKIFPPTSSSYDTKVFRFACELYEMVDPHVLQVALNRTLEAFPLYQSILRKGLFWYYLESTPLQPKVEKEKPGPCSTIYRKNIKGLLFRVSYYHKRINLEVYHALTDGTGALQFLRTIVYHYLCIKHADELATLTPVLDYDASFMQKSDDSFQKYYVSKGAKREKVKHKPAYRIRGERLEGHPTRVIEGTTSVKAVLALAHQYNTTLTVFLSAVFMYAVSQEMSFNDKKRPIVITVPINLRPYFPSASARNFFSVMNIGLDFNKENVVLETVVQDLHKKFQKELTTEILQKKLNTLMDFERLFFARITPVPLKDMVLQAANRREESGITIALSNIGQVKMPPELTSYIRLFDFFVSTRRLQLSLCSYEDVLTMSFSSSFVSTEVQRHFFRILKEHGLSIEITSNSGL